MSGISRRQVMRGALLGAAAMSLRGLADAQQSVPDVTRAGAPGSAIIPPNGVPVDKPRLTGVRRVIVDTDPGNDDALAILMALSTPSLQVEAVTVCPGNMGLEGYDQQVRNALYMVDLAGAGSRVPVHRGIPRPILGRPYPAASFIHGNMDWERSRSPRSGSRSSLSTRAMPCAALSTALRARSRSSRSAG
jgi:hypothetical protein